MPSCPAVTAETVPDYVSMWCKEESERLSRRVERQLGKLVCSLDHLVEYYGVAIEGGLARGQILPP